MKRIRLFKILSAAGTLIGSMTVSVWACACGCGVFDVQTGSLFPTKSGGTAFLEYDYLNQDKNWSGTSSAPSDNNDNKRIWTHFITLGGQYMFNRSWGILAEVPYVDRHFRTADENGIIHTFNATGVGDIRIRGLYTGFSEDMSTAIKFGVQLPTGSYNKPNFDRDTQIGMGSTEALLGAYHLGRLPFNQWDWFVNGGAQVPVLNNSDAYQPGSEVDAAMGVYYQGLVLKKTRICPIGQVVGSYHWSDHGRNAEPENTGYTRVLLSPGVEVGAGKWKVYGDAGFPVYQDITGDQLISQVLYNVNISRDF